MDLLAWIAASPPAAALKASGTLYLFVNAAHILSIGLIVGSILPLDLRLIGLLRGPPVAVLGPFLSRAAATGTVLAILTGLCLFSVRPTEYAGNPAFLTKVTLVAAGIFNAFALRLTGHWRRMVAGGAVHPLLRLQAFVSLSIWLAAVVAGRWIGFL
ncbi:MAG: DUF2214 domain-containing protein [Shinella sp.]|nr:DUF2214 domain-containing protein [Shinella sp.]